MELSDWLQLHPDCRPAPFGMGGFPTDPASSPSPDGEARKDSVFDGRAEKINRIGLLPAVHVVPEPAVRARKPKNSPQIWYRLTLQRMREKQQGKF